jgi:hypothetical protein
VPERMYGSEKAELTTTEKLTRGEASDKVGRTIKSRTRNLFYKLNRSVVMNREQIRNFKEAIATYLKVLAIRYLEIMSKTTTIKID